jgi:hypothetical protein
MRPTIAFLVALLCACGSTYDVCGPSTCPDGCCTADGECSAGNFDVSCGHGGLACAVCSSSAPRCEQQVCRAPSSGGGADAGIDAGADAGEMDAGFDAGSSKMVAVELVYFRDEVDSSTCPVTHQVIECRQSKEIPENRLPELQQDYAACTFFTVANDGGYRFECFNCDKQKPAACTLPDGGTDGHQIQDCDFPPYTVADFCAWQLP